MRIDTHPVQFTFVGAAEHGGRTAAKITTSAGIRVDDVSAPIGEKTEVPGAFYFDTSMGRIVGFEARAEDLGPSKAAYNCSITLSDVKPASQ